MNMGVLETYLQQYGWAYEKVDEEPDVLVTEFVTKSEDLRFLVIIQWAHPWIRLRIPVYAPLPAPDEQAIFFKRLLQSNYASRWVFFALDSHERLTLCVDLFAEEDLAYEQFEVALTALAYVAETAYAFVNGNAS